MHGATVPDSDRSCNCHHLRIQVCRWSD